MSAKAISTQGVSLSAQDLIGLRAQVHLQSASTPPISAMPGSFVIKRRGQGQDTTGSRVYVSGDDFRHLDRGATARTGVPHVRTYREERDRVTFLVADFRPSMLWGTKRAFRSVAAAEALTLLGWHAVETGARVGLLALSAGPPVIVPTRGRVRGMLDVIGGLVRAHAQALSLADQGDTNLDGAFANLHRIAARGSEIFIASGFETQGDDLNEVLGDLARHRAPKLLVVEDGTAMSLPSGFYPLETSGGRVVRADVTESARADEATLPLPADLPQIRVNSNLPVNMQVLAGAA